MKRSEFVDKVLRISLVRCKGMRADSPQACKHIVDEIIDICEGLGMQPPFSYTENYATETYAEFYEWEPEDE
jgi:hypothetical protein